MLSWRNEWYNENICRSAAITDDSTTPESAEEAEDSNTAAVTQEEESSAASTHYDVFISYAHADEQQCRMIIAMLQKYIPHIKLFVDRSELTTGELCTTIRIFALLQRIFSIKCFVCQRNEYSNIICTRNLGNGPTSIPWWNSWAINEHISTHLGSIYAHRKTMILGKWFCLLGVLACLLRWFTLLFIRHGISLL